MKELFNLYFLQIKEGINQYLMPVKRYKNKFVLSLFKYNLAKKDFLNFEIEKHGKKYSFIFDKALNIYEYLEDELYVVISYTKHVYNNEDNSPIIEVKSHEYKVYYKDVLLYTKVEQERYNTAKTCLHAIKYIEYFLSVKNNNSKDAPSRFEEKNISNQTSFLFINGEFFLTAEHHPILKENTLVSKAILSDREQNIIKSKSIFSNIKDNIFLKNSNILLSNTSTYYSLDLNHVIYQFMGKSLKDEISYHTTRFKLIINYLDYICNIEKFIRVINIRINSDTYYIGYPDNITIDIFNKSIIESFINLLLVSFSDDEIREYCSLDKYQKIIDDHLNLYKMHII